MSLPPPTGPLALGTRILHLVDPARPDPLAGGGPRQLTAQLFYPAGPSTEPLAPLVPERAEIMRWLSSTRWPDDEARLLAHVYGAGLSHARLGAAPMPMARWPLLLFSPGGYQSRHHYAGLAQELASHGRIVVTMSHPLAGLEFFPGLGMVGRHPAWTLPQDDPARRAAILEELTACLVADARLVLDTLLDLPMVDQERIAIMGHSRGGRTAARLAATDRRIGAAVILDNPPAFGGGGPPCPFLLLRVAEPELDHHWQRSGPARWTRESMASARALVRDSAMPAADIAIRDIGHLNFSDRCLLEPKRFPTRMGAMPAFALISTLIRRFLAGPARFDPGPLAAGEGVVDATLQPALAQSSEGEDLV